MVTRLKNLTESLEKGLNESSSINEAWNDSFPRWLKDELARESKLIGTGNTKHDQKIDYGSASTVGTRVPSYVKPKGFYGAKDNLSLFRKMLTETDPQHLEVIEGPLPEKKSDPRLKEPNIPIWGFGNGQVYIPGFNDNETSPIKKNPKGADLAFKYIPYKDLLGNAVHFAYIEGSKLPDSNYHDVRMARAEKSQGLRKMNYGREGDPGQFRKSEITYGDTTHRDKSGYIVDPSKYKKELERIKADRYELELENIRNEVISIQNDISAAMAYHDPFDNSGKDSYSKLITKARDLRDFIHTYNDYVDMIKKAAESNSYSDAYKRDRISGLLKDLRDDVDYRSIHDMDDVILASADWLE